MADKSAYVRVYVRSNLAPVLNVAATVTLQKMRYGVWVDSATLKPEFPGSITANNDPAYANERGSLWNSLNFIIPAAVMRGQIWLKCTSSRAATAATRQIPRWTWMYHCFRS